MKKSISAPHASFLRATSALILLALGVLSCKHDVTAPVIAANGFVSITAGGGHTCALNSKGAAYCWGSNLSDQLGDSTSVQSRTTPTLVAGGHTFVGITAGLSHTCALTAAGAAYCWGGNESGELGDGTTTQRPVPTLVTGVTFASIVTGARSSHTCGITTAGLTYCWGASGSRQLGTAPADPTTSPGLVQGGLQFSSISVGENHTCALTKQGAAYCWGDDNGELGIGTPDTTVIPAPTAVQGGLTFTSIGASLMFTCGVATGGSAHCWGDNADGELGDGTPITRTTPVVVLGGLTFASVVSSGGPHACGLTAAGAAYCWGDDFYGELGDGTTQSGDTPVPVSGGLVFRSIVSGANHNCGLTAAGVAYCWGDNGSGELGIGTQYSSSNVPVEVIAP